MANGGADALSPIHALVAERAGSSLSPQQRQRLDEALVRRRAGRSDAMLLSYLQSPQGAPELSELMAVLSVHKTDLFRDEVQLRAFFAGVLVPKVLELRRPLRVWSAGCATGEEVATLLILLSEAGADPRSEVVGSDISEWALGRARALTFEEDVMRRVSGDRRYAYFEQRPEGLVLKKGLSDRARFLQHNLMDLPYPRPSFGEGFDVIFCRNVLIYFTESAFDRTVGWLGDRLAPDGVMVLSAAEPILRPCPTLEARKVGDAFFYVRAGTQGGGAPTSRSKLPAVRLPPPPPPPPAARKVLEPPRPAVAIPPVPIPPVPMASPTAPDLGVEDPFIESQLRFQRVLEWAGAGNDESEAEGGLRRCVFLDPHFAQARYLLGMLLEARGARAEAAAEYRRAHSALEQGRVRPIPFFLNEARLKLACAEAVRRLGFGRT